MVPKRFIHIVMLITLCTWLATPAALAEVKPPSSADGPAPANHPAPLESPRLIVELASPPLAAVYLTAVTAAAVNGKLDASSTAAQAYVSQLQAEQAAFASSLQAAMPSATVATYLNESGASVAATYQVVFNGLAINPGMDRAAAQAQIAHMPGVKAVYLDRPYATDLYTSTALIDAPVAWANPAVGGRGNGGAGVKFASLDGGIHKDAPMFSGAGYTYPPGYGPNGLGLTANNNGKIIASRAYFRPWDPPAPGDENPWPGVNGTPHGVHTSSIAAGNIVTDATFLGFDAGTMSGVAPGAYVMSYRMFYASVNGNESSYTAETLAALEDIVKDGADVLNGSWGEGPITEGGVFDPIDEALINTAKAGVFISMSNGNAGPGLGTSDHPSDAYINVAASTTSGTLAAGRLNVTAPTPVDPALQDLAYGSADFGPPLAIGASEAISGTFVWAGTVDAANTTGCNPFPAGSFAGKVALISRGVCFFSDKAFNAQQAGATFAVIYNNAGDGLMGMSCGSHCEAGAITISSIFIGQTPGEAMAMWAQTNGDDAKLVVDTVAFQFGNTSDQIASFSSRGPGVGNTLKPDIAAPGVNILAQGYRPDATGEARHLGYGQVSGTSMAAPHVAGAAVLLRQIHPEWSNAYIKSALMSTSKYMNVFLSDGVTPAQPLDMGAGRLDLANAADPGVILNPPSLSFGVSPTGTQKTLTFHLLSVAGSAETYNLSTLSTRNGFTQTDVLAGFTVSPTVVSLDPGQSATVQVSLDPASSAGFGDNQGFLVLDGPTHDAHMPIWARVTHAAPLADVLLIDNDFSDLVQDYDYRWYYTSALDQLGYTYAVWNTDDFAGSPTTIPDAATLAAYKAVIYFTGENYQPDGTFTVHTGLTQLDQDRLVEYLNGGGALIAMGQDLASALGAAEFDAPLGSRNFFYVYRLGANYIQDSVSDSTTPTELIIPTSAAPAAFKDVIVDLTKTRKYEISGDLTGSSEAPPVTTDTTGSFTMRYDVDQNRLSYSVTVIPTDTTPITVTLSHIHMGDVGVSGGVVRDLFATAGFTQPVFVTDELTFAGVVTPSLSTAEIEQLLGGHYYVNVHTTAHGPGEVRGQIEPEARDNQPYVDEVDNVFHDGSQDPGHGGDGGTAESNLASTLLLRYGGPFNQFDGAVAVAQRDQPSLERPGTDYSGRSVYTTFGLEGVSNDFNATAGITPTTRTELLEKMLDWAWSEPPQAVITATTSSNASLLTQFTVALTATNASAVQYRWDFGDGSPYAGPIAQPQVGHQYTLCGSYTARVEITDSNGNVTIASQPVNVGANCAESLLHLPLISTP